MCVSVVAPFTTCRMTLPVSALKLTSCFTVVDDCWKLPHRLAGAASVSTGGTGSTHRSTGTLVPMLAGLTGSVTRTRSSVGVAIVPFVFSMLLGRVMPGKWAAKPRPAGQLSAATAATAVTDAPS
jgi:hypothetical protein